ncbi:MAG: threonine synthase [Legionellales bacterium]|nr:threonine synthase [Legionellales bacterium]
MSGIIEKYKTYLPLVNDEIIISLGEGNTPLVRLLNLEKKVGRSLRIYAKVEGANPTGSFKDRGMTLAMSNAVAKNAPAVICASTGNTSAAAAAYAAKAGLKAFVIIPEGKIAMGKLMQAYIYGAMVIQIKGNFDQGLTIVKEIASNESITLVNSLNPYRIPGQQTAAYEIVDQLQLAPDYHFLPIGNGGNTTAYWQGYETYRNAGKYHKSPQIFACQAENAAPFVEGHFVDKPETIATAIRIGKPAYWQQSNIAIEASEGRFLACSDACIIKAQQMLAAQEGIFCEPASAASIAGLLKAIENNFVQEGTTIVCTLTGNGLKDTQLVEQHLDFQLNSVSPSLDAVRKIIEQAI